jgi:hypothetical protein
MSSFRSQLEAVGSALLLIEKLPADTVWALELTNDDDAESPSVLNIFAEREAWPKLQVSLRLGRPVDREETFISWRQGTLHISFIEQHEQE